MLLHNSSLNRNQKQQMKPVNIFIQHHHLRRDIGVISLTVSHASQFWKVIYHSNTHEQKAKHFTSSRSVKLILCRSLSSSAWSGTDIWVVYFIWGKEWGVRALLRPAPGVDSGEISLVRRLSTTAADSFFLFFSDDRLAFFCCTPQSLGKHTKKQHFFEVNYYSR